MRRMQVVAVAAILSWGASAGAQSAAICAFDGSTGSVTVSVNGEKATLRVLASSGEIQLNGAACGGATVSNTDFIQVNGGSLVDKVTLAGTFAPGRTAEGDGNDEIEVAFALADGNDAVTIALTGAADRLIFTASGIDVGGDLDEDLVTAGIDVLTIDGKGGNDVIDASAYAGTPHGGGGAGGRLDIRGGSGNDRLTGDTATNYLYGEEGDDLLYGMGNRDRLYGGPGNDLMAGGLGDDFLYSDPIADGSDVMRGGEGNDAVYYDQRTTALVVTIGNGMADDGEPGEADFVEASVEYVYSGSGDDLLIGSARDDFLGGGPGDDEIHGAGGDDILTGGAGDDLLDGGPGNDAFAGDTGVDTIDYSSRTNRVSVTLGGGGGESGELDTYWRPDIENVIGGSGNDTLIGDDLDNFLSGGGGNDVLRGRAGADILEGGDGNDTLDGGSGTDLYFGEAGDDVITNLDGLAETVDCGDGIDDAEPDSLDTLVGCEL